MEIYNLKSESGNNDFDIVITDGMNIICKYIVSGSLNENSAINESIFDYLTNNAGPDEINYLYGYQE